MTTEQAQTIGGIMALVVAAGVLILLCVLLRTPRKDA